MVNMTKFASFAATLALVVSASPVFAWETPPSPSEEIKVSNKNSAEIYSEVKTVANTGKNEINACCKEKENCKPECNKYGMHNKYNKNKCKKCECGKNKCNEECECPTITTKPAQSYADSSIKANENKVNVSLEKVHKLTIENENSAYVESSVVSVANTGKNKISGKGKIITEGATSNACSSIVVNSNIVEIEK